MFLIAILGMIFSQNIPFGVPMEYVDTAYIDKHHVDDVPCEQLNMICTKYNSLEGSYLKGWYLSYKFNEHNQLISINKTYRPYVRRNGDVSLFSLQKMYRNAKRKLENLSYILTEEEKLDSIEYYGVNENDLISAIIDGSIQINTVYIRDSVEAKVSISVGPDFLRCNPNMYDCHEFFRDHLTVNVRYNYIPLIDSKKVRLF